MIDISLISRIETGQIDYPPNRTLGPRRQTDLQLVMLDKGSVEIDIHQTKIYLKPGQIACLWPGFREKFQFDKHQASSHRWIAMSPIDDAASQKLLSLRASLQSTGIETALMAELFELAHKGHGTLHTQVPDRISQSGWLDIQRLLALSYFTAFTDQAELEDNATEQTLMPPPLVKLSRFIEQNYHRSLSLDDLAAASSVTGSYLVRLCRKHRRLTPMQWLWKVRIERANHLLKDTALTIAEIAYRTGYANPYHFSRQYRQMIGVTPTEARRIAWHMHLD